MQGQEADCLFYILPYMHRLDFMVKRPEERGLSLVCRDED